MIDDALNASRVRQLADQSGPAPLDAKALREQISEQLTRLVELYPDAPESWKTASRVDQLAMTDAAEAGDLAGYVAAAHRRVDHSRMFLVAERDPQLRLEATLWLSQAQRVLATALRLSQQYDAAADVLTLALENCRSLSGSDQHRGLRFETAEVLTEQATVTASRSEVNAARAQLTEALDLLVRLVHEYPDDVAYRVQFATALLQSAELSETQNEQSNAREQLNTAAEQVRRALELSPGNSGAETLQSAISSAQIRMTP